MEQKRIVALGFFDGVHLGHGALLRACRNLAREQGCLAAAVTFSAHPEMLLRGNAPALINTASDRERIMLTQYQMDQVITLPFDRNMMELPWQDFFKMLCRNYHAAGFVCGHDFRFGFRGQGTATLLQQLCGENDMPCVVIPEQRLQGVTISSTHIRSLLQQGQVEQAARFLGHPHIFTGEVVTGRQLGHKLGFPTANLLLPEDVICPKYGVYACRVDIDGQSHQAVTNVGRRPTVQGHRLTVEPWILDFQGDLYGRTITLEFHRFLRPEQRFDSLEQLRSAVMEDGQKARKFFGNK